MIHVAIMTRIRNSEIVCILYFGVNFVQCVFLTKLFVFHEVGHLLAGPTHFPRLPRHAEAEGPTSADRQLMHKPAD